ncbi:MAG: hypothetical protein JNK47_20280 [Mesorhizobium sp.]|nr:hypothetical protein [Mesorhizobium sp.]MBL8579549.1 hypothetical protein [Mesorhizobium sp.]
MTPLEASENNRRVLWRALVTIAQTLDSAEGYRKRRLLKAERECIQSARECAREVVAAGFVQLVPPANDEAS